MSAHGPDLSAWQLSRQEWEPLSSREIWLERVT
jgi:hypothetical protein